MLNKRRLLTKFTHPHSPFLVSGLGRGGLALATSRSKTGFGSPYELPGIDLKALAEFPPSRVSAYSQTQGQTTHYAPMTPASEQLGWWVSHSLRLVRCYF